MINHSLQLFCNRVVAAGRITAADVQVLGRDILPDGISHADEADMLIALDRAVPQSDVSYADLVSAAVVNFAVWGERPTGYVDVEIARWLVGSLRSDAGPTPLAARIAFEIVREAETSHEILVAFAIGSAHRRLHVEEATSVSPVELLDAA
ncbi:MULTISPECIES: hypothetical protein [unclassified Methylobacterium]|uniref:hypothetical protein n=1 Tax=unclassified Methylobacterium TaxID=2615210 RepID=UPI0006FB20E8|nr:MULTISPECIES: hypothetical protein [unclassified Methylobacterium]KQO52143.1 hypothetical protein ASF24_05960 [Methylobacterium sp. Leaf86]KQO98983.1 hypothetical protein ASF32_14035 [Methylobacterium sp. Leaf91]